MQFVTCKTCGATGLDEVDAERTRPRCRSCKSRTWHRLSPAEIDGWTTVSQCTECGFGFIHDKAGLTPSTVGPCRMCGSLSSWVIPGKDVARVTNELEHVQPPPRSAFGFRGRAIVQYCRFQNFDTGISADGHLTIGRTEFKNVNTAIDAADGSTIDGQGFTHS